MVGVLILGNAVLVVDLGILNTSTAYGGGSTN